MSLGFGTDIAANAIAGKPVIPQWTPVSLTSDQTEIGNANLESLPVAEQTATDVNSFNQSQLNQTLENIIPGYQSMVSGASSAIQNLVSGKLPGDVAANVQNSAAAKSLTGGFGGSGIAGNLSARDLGLTSLQLTSKGISSAQSWMSSMNSLANPGQFNVTSMFISPQQEFQDTMQNQEAQFQRDYASNMNDWQHSGGAAAGQDLTSSAGTIAGIAALALL